VIRWRLLGRAALDLVVPVAFCVVTFLIVGAVVMGGDPGIDARIYYRGSAAWLAGGSPWDAYVGRDVEPAHYAGLPTTVILLAPFTYLPEPVFVALSIATGAVAAVYTVRTLRLPWWYLLFPPLVAAVLSGNPSAVVIALLVSSRPAVQAVAALLKVYAIVPPALLLHWRTLAWAAAFTALTLLALPLWIEYLTRFAEITARLADESNGGLSPFRTGVWAEALTLVALVVLWFRNREAASWMAVPAAWPSSEHHYATFALPLLRERPWLALFLAVAPGFVWVGVLLLLLEDIVRKRRAPAADDQDATVTQ